MLHLGQVVTTAAIHSLISDLGNFHTFVIRSLCRHHKLDYGDLCKDDINANTAAISNGQRVFSSYNVPEGHECRYEKIYIITEADRSVTTVLFPHEY